MIDRLADLLARRVGLEVDALGRGSVEAALRERQTAAGGGVEAYLARLAGDDSEATALIEDVVVPETWFFRDGAPFAHLAQIGLARVTQHGKVRALSLPCSSGEEAYSIAMALNDAGIAPDSISIDAIDLSARLIERGRRGVYERGSFRGADLGFRDRHFVAEGTSWRIGDALRGCVRFAQGNCLDPALFANRGPYDAIFFRNLLIYLTPEARVTALSSINSRLADGGVIYAGHAEAIDRLDARFRGIPHTGAFAFRRVEDAPASSPSPRAPTAPPRAPTAPPRAPTAPPRAVTGPIPTLPAPPTPAPAAPTAKDPGPSLAAIRALADRGALAQAAAACDHHLRMNPLSAEGFYLLGLVHGAAGKEDAARTAFERAVYLSPDHYEALVQLALGAERRGDRAAAARLRRRAERVAEGKR